MNKKMLRSTILGLTLVVNALTVCSCGAEEQSRTIEAEEGPLGKYAEELHVKTVKYLDGSAASYLSQLTGITGETLTDNRWTRGYKDDLNMTFEYMITGSGEAFNTAWSGLLATGEIPDIFAIGYQDFEEMYQNEYLADLTEAYEKYASPLLKEIISESNENALNSCMHDGKLYGIPVVVSQYDSYKYLWIRRDWMEKVGVLEAPKTLDELISLMGKFVTEDPDGDGKNDTYAFALSNDLWYPLEGLFACYGAYPDSYILGDDGTIVPGFLQDEMVEALGVIQDMYAKGWINPEFITNDYNKTKTDIVNGLSGIYMGAHYNAQDVLLPCKANDEKADWAVFPWPGKTATDEVTLQLENGINSVLSVNKKFGNPEAAVKMLNYYYEKLYGETGDYDTYGNDEVDYIWAMGPLHSYRPTVNSVPYKEIQEVLAGRMDVRDLKGVSKNYYKNVVIDDRYDWNIMFGTLPESNVKGGHCAGYYLDKVVNKEIKTFSNYYFGAPTETILLYGTQLGIEFSTYCTQVITGEKNLTTDWEEIKKYWYDNGGRKICQELTERYNDQHGSN